MLPKFGRPANSKVALVKSSIQKIRAKKDTCLKYILI